MNEAENVLLSRQTNPCDPGAQKERPAYGLDSANNVLSWYVRHTFSRSDTSEAGRLTEVSTLFQEVQEARFAAAQIRLELGLPAKRVEIIGPADLAVLHRLKRRQQGFENALANSSVLLAMCGFIIGVLFSSGLIAAGVKWAVSSPYLTLLTGSIFGVMSGYILGGLITLLPERNMFLHQLEEAVEDGQWAVIAYPVNLEEKQRVMDVFKRTGGQMVHALW